MLNDADDQIASFEFSNAPLFEKWQLSRAIDDSASGSDGYTLQNYTVPANGYTNFYTGALAADKGLYLRVNGGNGILFAQPCASGYTAQPNQTYKVTLADLNLDLSKQYLQFTNTGTVPVAVRAGFKN